MDIDAYVKAVVDRAPPLTTEQRTRLAVLLRPIQTVNTRGTETDAA